MPDRHPWICPACGCGCAPDAEVCGNCVARRAMAPAPLAPSPLPAQPFVPPLPFTPYLQPFTVPLPYTLGDPVCAPPVTLDGFAVRYEPAPDGTLVAKCGAPGCDGEPNVWAGRTGVHVHGFSIPIAVDLSTGAPRA